MATSGGAQEAKPITRIPPPAIFVTLIVIGLALKYFVLPIGFHLPAVARWIGGGVVLTAGIALNSWCMIQFRRTDQDPRPWVVHEKAPILLAQGPYRFSRNPMYLSVLVILAGVALLFDDLWIAIGGIAFVAIVNFTSVVPEEAHLRRTIGAPYEDYARRVRRWL